MITIITKTLSFSFLTSNVLQILHFYKDIKLLLEVIEIKN